MCDMTHEDSSTWLNDILVTKDLLNRMAFNNRLAARCLAVFNRLSPLFDSGTTIPQNLDSWDGTGMSTIPEDQFGDGFWDWANNEMNWTI